LDVIVDSHVTKVTLDVRHIMDSYSTWLHNLDGGEPLNIRVTTRLTIPFLFAYGTLRPQHGMKMKCGCETIFLPKFVPISNGKSPAENRSLCSKSPCHKLSPQSTCYHGNERGYAMLRVAIYGNERGYAMLRNASCRHPYWYSAYTSCTSFSVR
jgi:hypothetical protein